MSTQEHPDISATFGANEWLIEELYEKYRQDKRSVDPAWWDFFADYEREGGAGAADDVESAPPGQTPATPAERIPGTGNGAAAGTTPPQQAPAEQAPARPARDEQAPSKPAPQAQAQQAPARPAQADQAPAQPASAEAAPAAQAVEQAPAAVDAPTAPPTPASVPAVDDRTTVAQDQVRGDLPPAPPVTAQPPTSPYAERAAQTASSAATAAEDETVKLRGVAARTASNMEASIEVPVATSVRAVPAKVMVDNRIVINNHLARSRGGKISFTHLIGFAMIEALAEVPEMNHSFTQTEDGKPAVFEPAHVNFGLAIDLPRPDGTRTLVVPSVKRAEEMDFAQFWRAYEDLVRRARDNKLTVEDYAGTTISLTNPGGIGTVHSIPRLMKGQGTIVGVGAMEYPAEFAGTSAKALARMGVSKVLTLTSTYDHRIIQGAASGEFLRAIHTKLLGTDGFYDRVYAALRVPYEPVRWMRDVEYSAETELGKPARIAELIHAYRSRGHFLADTDPLSYRQRRHADLDITSYGLTLWDLERTFPTGGLGGSPQMTLRDILGLLRDAYCRTIGVEYMHIADRAQREWFQERLETPYAKPSSEQQLQILRKLGQAEAFETFLQTKFVGQKRFSLEGGESLIPLLDTVLTGAAREGLDEVAIGMAHRGRLNVLANIAGKSYGQIFSEFEGNQDPRTVHGSGDVKYHLGTEGVFTSPDGETTKVYLAANPSHLEAGDGVLEGVVRAKQDRIDLGEAGFSVLPILIHGDAAFAGQGVVTETLNLSQLRGYRTGGTVHIIVNNQIGFTTGPSSARSSYYPTDIAKGLQVPVLHVNGDDPEAVARVAELAFEYRQDFHKDVIVDLVCYRRRGHNEGDDPSMTQPVMYSLIENKRSTRTLYTESLIGRGDLTEEQAEAALKEYQQELEKAFTETRDGGWTPPQTGEQVLGLERPESQQEDAGMMVGWQTAVPAEVLQRIGQAHVRPPADFAVHPKLEKLLARREEMSRAGGIDWGFGELLAFGSLLMEGTPVRLAGQDTRRGTFVQRHSVLHDHTNGAEWTPLMYLTPDQAKFWVYDSSLSEYAAMAFEYGYSVERPDALVLWEAQFGDFANGAQIVVDEFISSAEQKWGQHSSLVLLLPHGYEGQGPDHSSGRIERFLQMCAEENMIVAQSSTPANHFHLLRRQAYARPRKPLVAFTPKQLLRLKAAASAVEDFTSGTFRTVIGEVEQRVRDGGEQVERVLLCSGRIYYDLAARRLKDVDDKVAIVRLEQLYPLDLDAVRAELARYPRAEVVWVQDEPENQGPWTFVSDHLPPALDGRELRVVSRPAAASPSTGSHKRHVEENAQLMDAAFAR
ncbi:multifunctional oxoglutarate decarboxylase/oxoglutarate dehydrogenase thiamine pyrophosphate-binding subunit/dihydrolipoyllysine-residue succinyltransferase subunit [Georgenia sp. TF02-10]|uniref:multifunctional oxoglutarate decarboxylase/oxoglutarate dehydrogenase thiamine pyrophosphate-binding subunit/dihydrolipoyllysine-residue succinyltransferase subunit n=1 Tax=Georgenia sp. TF02-10 TaxID=2917725 RepID=UPI001FA739EE|nr:multifunctional oxoglutarate decarboxylase/oxoglutarate dehydrogenase thiamine pyrophosphate-binding subunit/dihydrolipoyllysine-residue succinyltransferase subunit [Georgenia sp. TF02-10]UNX53998.1 multifunctional oxoglutarate decarboxylase/oxoglutarate dehydrogenase thiamine pyrophosphate-binding subunit/dihydrolipoyllysine-residue succinyltransferase subunit [Georgenia sp. TF02-10]